MVSADFEEYSNKGIFIYYQKILPFDNKESKTIEWVLSVIEDQRFSVSSLNYIICNDEQLHKINLEHLNHDTYTDIITFDYSEEKSVLESDIYISIDRITENANKFGKTFDEELHRVMIHGVLHLMGYKDKTSEEKHEMREKENACLSLRKK